MDKIISLAPARVCLFGDHQDYLELPIIACAINRFMTLTARKNNTEYFIITKPDINETETININKIYDVVASNDYLGAALKVLRVYGCIPTIGYDIEITGNIAINAGTSSSSALIISWIHFLLEAFGGHHEVTPDILAKIAYEAEVLEHSSSGGKMDQYSIALGNIIYLETNTQSYYKTIGSQIEGLIIAESGIPKPTSLVLKELKDKTLKSIRIIENEFPDFEITTAKETDVLKYLDFLAPNLHDCFTAAISNYAITQNALQEFNKESLNIPRIGRLMSEHHQVLKEKLDLTVPKIDAMINGALSAGAYGAKIVGSGRGGCIVALASKENEAAVISNLKDAGSVNVYKVLVDSGARIIS